MKFTLPLVFATSLLPAVSYAAPQAAATIQATAPALADNEDWLYELEFMHEFASDETLTAIAALGALSEGAEDDLEGTVKLMESMLPEIKNPEVARAARIMIIHLYEEEAQLSKALSHVEFLISDTSWIKSASEAKTDCETCAKWADWKGDWHDWDGHSDDWDHDDDWEEEGPEWMYEIVDLAELAEQPELAAIAAAWIGAESFGEDRCRHHRLAGVPDQ